MLYKESLQAGGGVLQKRRAGVRGAGYGQQRGHLAPDVGSTVLRPQSAVETDLPAGREAEKSRPPPSGRGSYFETKSGAIYILYVKTLRMNGSNLNYVRCLVMIIFLSRSFYLK